MKLLLTAVFFALGCHAACTGVQRVDGEMVSSCTDEGTGFGFDYVDINKTMEDSGIAENDMPAMMYSRYLAGAGNQTFSDNSPVEKRALYYWNSCGDNVAGRCDKNYAVDWDGGLRTYRQDTQTLLQRTQNGRTGKKPRSICTNFNQGTICVSWAAYYRANMKYAQVMDIASQCAETCEQQNESCLARANSYGEDKYFCVSNRARGCSADTSIRNC